MSIAKRQKIDRESKAAYIASQPLFDALRNATSALSEQKALLKTARDTVQALHVKVINGDAEQHELYMRNIVASWVGVTETYHDVFRQLVLLTAADPSEGREAAGPHGHLVAVLETVREAKDLAQEVWTAKVDAATSEDDDAAQEENAEVSMKEVESGSSSDSPPIVESSSSTLATRVHKRPFVEEVPAEEGVKKTQKLDDTAPKASTGAKLDKKTKTQNAKARRKALKKEAAGMASAGQAKPESVTNNHNPAPPFTTEPETSHASGPLVEYEDVQVEVDARVKAKAEKVAARKARRAEKKRKRESVDSFAKIEIDEEAVKGEPDHEPATANEERVTKPEKKKPKKAHVKVESDIGGTAANASAAISRPEQATLNVKVAASAADSDIKAKKRRPDVESSTVDGGNGKKRKTKHTGKG